MGGSALTHQTAADERVCGEDEQEGGRERGRLFHDLWLMIG